METIYTHNGLTIEAKLIKNYEHGKLFFLQERLVITDNDNHEISSFDVISFIEQIAY